MIKNEVEVGKNISKISRHVVGKTSKKEFLSSFQDGKKNIECSFFRHSLHLPKVSFSPASGGRVKPRRAIEEMRTQGTIRLKK